ncbi:MAG: serine/threonine protein kinase [Thermoanaerobaculia bacterium]|nr:serine/threonine protein kinase [Thermoanaerobaculia bacterium]
MGDVYLVRHQHLQELRVVKVLRTDLADDNSAMRRFQQEARVATQIKHPNVATLYDYSRLKDGRYYMVWEYIEGEHLGATIRERGPLPVELALDFAIQSLRGLDAIHAAGVIHRDVSPDNLMVTRDRRGRNRIKIIDLGLAKDLQPDKGMELTQVGTFLGKFQYCSPEQAGEGEEPLDARSDLYSLAQVLYELLTGLPPFDSQSQHGFVFKRLTEQPLPLRRRNPKIELPDDLEQVVMKGLERDRNDRYPDASHFIHALAAVLDHHRGLATRDLGSASDTGNQPIASAASLLPPKRSVTKAARPSVSRASGSVELTPDERTALLAQIDRAASRVSETSKVFRRAEIALKEGRFEEAGKFVGSLEKSHPKLKGLGELKARLGDAEGIARRRQQVVQAEQMLEKYLLERQQTLARFALETLLDMYPNHPKRSDYESWVDLLADEAAQQAKAEAAFEEGRSAIARGEFVEARRQLAEVEKFDLSLQLAGTLLSELQEAERGEQQGQEVGVVRGRLQAHLEAGDFAAATEELEHLKRLGIARITLDGLRARIEEARAQLEQSTATAAFEGRYRAAVGTHDWMTARAVISELEEAFPDSVRARQMFAEIARLQAVEQKQKAIADGLQAFDTFLKSGDLDQASVALRVIRQMAREDPAVIEAGRRLEEIQG